VRAPRQKRSLQFALKITNIKRGEQLAQIVGLASGRRSNLISSLPPRRMGGIHNNRMQDIVSIRSLMIL
jgi:hypothetical protein